MIIPSTLAPSEVADVRAAVHCLHQCVSLQRLHIVECDRDARLPAGVLEALVLRVEQYGAEAAVTAVVLVGALK